MSKYTEIKDADHCVAYSAAATAHALEFRAMWEVLHPLRPARRPTRVPRMGFPAPNASLRQHRTSEERNWRPKAKHR